MTSHDTDGMTDLQFKSFLRLLIADLERAEQAETPEKVLEEVTRLKQLLQEDLESYPPAPLSGGRFPFSGVLRKPHAVRPPENARRSGRCSGIMWYNIKT